jgi:hypothetical protein
MTVTAAEVYWLASSALVLILGGVLVPGYRALSWTLVLGGVAVLCVATAIYFRSSP